ncbi:uncharacterized protein [Amphiura filiformis]|uniref:uncharacterized protein n=1 Tax=Amphiura filiformis TaxID=82378 RepID=UPI003B222C99
MCSETVAHSVQLRAYSSVKEIMQQLSNSLQLPNSSDGKVSTFCRYALQHLNCTKRNYLFIFENVETFVSHQYSDQLDLFLDMCTELATSKSNNMFVIFTTQVRIDFVRNLSMIERRNIPPLSFEESIELVNIVAGTDTNLSETCYMEIFKQTGGLPRKLIEVGCKLQQMTDLPRSPQDPLSHLNLSPLSAELWILNDISKYLRNDLLTLSYFPGSFSAEAATAILGSQKASFAKHDVLSPLHSHCLISTEDTPMHRFAIQPFLRHFLEELYLLYRNSDAKTRNRFCVFFAHLLKQMTHMEVYERHGERFSLFTMEVDNIQKLLLEAVHCLDENYDLFFDVAYNAEYYITNLLPKKESVDFYESMCNAARRRSKRHYGIMLSSFGQVLAFAQNRRAEAYQQYMKALDCLRPSGESTDLAWLYSHIGYVWHESGKFKKAERYFTISLRMLRRQNKMLSRHESQHSGLSLPIGLRQDRIILNRSISSVLSSLGLLYNHIDNYQKSIECHEEAMEVRKQLFGLHPSIGAGYNNLCLVYDRAGQRGKALEYAKKGLQIKRIFVKQPSNTVLVSLLNVALFTHH